MSLSGDLPSQDTTLAQLPVVGRRASGPAEGTPTKQIKNQSPKPTASTSSSRRTRPLPPCWAAAREAAAGLSPALLLLGQLSREDPGDSFGFLFREIGRGPGTIRPSVRDAPRHRSASALWRRSETLELYPASVFSAQRTPASRSVRDGGYKGEKKPSQSVLRCSPVLLGGVFPSFRTPRGSWLGKALLVPSPGEEKKNPRGCKLSLPAPGFGAAALLFLSAAESQSRRPKFKRSRPQRALASEL